MRFIALLSGGLDSTVSLKKALSEGTGVLALTFDYGQRAARQEIEASRRICEHLGVTHRVVNLPWLGEITDNPLVRSDRALPAITAEELDGSRANETAALVWVPNRNGVFVSIAAAFAESLECDAVVCGFNAEEAETFPDNSAAFVQAVNESLSFSTRSHVRLGSYTQDLNKADIVKLGRELAAPLHLVWSCYLGGEEMCGSCESCLRLQRALAVSKNNK